MKKYVSIDIGGTAIKYGLVNEKGEILESSQMKTEAHKGGPSILEKAVKIVENYVQRETICGRGRTLSIRTVRRQMRILCQGMV